MAQKDPVRGSGEFDWGPGLNPDPRTTDYVLSASEKARAQRMLDPMDDVTVVDVGQSG